jgi:hypothetical protein
MATAPTPQGEEMKIFNRRFIWVGTLALVLFVGLGPASQAGVNEPEELVSFLRIEVPGWQVKEGFPRWERVKGKQGTYLEAQIIYTSGQSTLTAVIMEGKVDDEIAQVKGFPESNNERGYCRKTTVQGFQAIELYEKAKKTGYLFILVAKNCMIPLEDTQVDSTKPLTDLISRIDLRRLAVLVK